jgi:hypothetical protein
MTSYVSAELRRLVESRAERTCEYCLIHESDTFFGCQVDHIVSEKHGGSTEGENLAYACTFCNQSKGTDVASVSPMTGGLVRLFNPRTDHWADHFSLRGNAIEPLTPIGEVTARILRLNEPERVLERETLIGMGRYPPSQAKTRLVKGDT